jgi:hypothetical protein
LEIQNSVKWNSREDAVTVDADVVAQLPWIKAIRPTKAPYQASSSGGSSAVVWHVEVEFQQWIIPPDLGVRWRENTPNNNETWRKRPLAVGNDSGCKYSCGEVELAARLQHAGYQARWISEWSGYPHVDCWKRFCVKRNELEHVAPELWAFDHNLRAKAERAGINLGRSGGHPDVAAWKSGQSELVFLEYKGPGDKINKKQEGWARVLEELSRDRVAYVVVKGVFRQSVASG